METMWLARFGDDPELHHMRISDDPKKLKKWVKNHYKHMGPFTFVPMGDDCIWIHDPDGSEIGSIVKIEVVE